MTIDRIKKILKENKIKIEILCLEKNKDFFKKSLNKPLLKCLKKLGDDSEKKY